MASWDYGCIIKKNGKIITGNDIYTNPVDTIGFTNKTLENCHACCGDKDLIFWFRRDYMYIFNKDMKEVLYVGYHDWEGTNIFYDKYSLKREINCIKLNFKRLDRGNRYKLRFWYKNNLYEVYYGYGIDSNIKCCYGFSNKLKNKFTKWLISK